MMITAENDLLQFLEANEVAFSRFEHPAVFTCAEAAQHRPVSPGTGGSGVETKNLFLRDDRRRYYLLMTACEKRVDLKRLARELEVSRLKFGEEQQLAGMLGLTPGAVTVLALVNDPSSQVTLLVDADYWPSPAYFCHPMVNTATLVVPHAALLRFLEVTGHAPRVVSAPGLGG